LDIVGVLGGEMSFDNVHRTTLPTQAIASEGADTLER
jgi:hypothetical protein